LLNLFARKRFCEGIQTTPHTGIEANTLKDKEKMRA